MTTEIEPPFEINTTKQGLRVIAEILSMLTEMDKLEEKRPIVGMMYLKFQNEEDMDSWVSSFRNISQHFWIEKMKRSESLHYYTVCRKEGTSWLCDLFFAETKEDTDKLAKGRFPGLNV
jgi:hypothetical protein